MIAARATCFTFGALAPLLIVTVARGGEAAREPRANDQQRAFDITAAELRPHVEYLASPKLEGRGTGRGKQLAREYLEKAFRELRLEPLFGKTGYEQDIPGPANQEGERKLLGKNLGAWLPGSDPA